jgi:iron complex transport system substrate-binding protein
MKKIAIVVCILVFGCNPPAATFVPGDPAYEPLHAAGFTIFETGDHSRTIRITDPWQGISGVDQWVFVSHENEEPPAGFTGTVLRSPARRIVCMSSSYVAFLGELGVGDRIVGVSGAQFITDSLINERLKAGDIADVGYDGNFDFERLASLRPDLMLVYGVTSDGGVTEKLREMGIPYVFVGDHLEPSPQGKAEWIVPLAEMCGVFDAGVARSMSISRIYDKLKARATTLAGDPAMMRPEVMLNAPYRDVWYVPGNDNYMVRLIRDAGGEYVCRGIEGRDSHPIDIEQAYLAMQRAEIWINTNHYSTISALLADNPRFAITPPVRGGRVYNNNARTTPAGGSDFWESGAVRPDRVLRDLITILHPEIISDSTLYYYRKLQ